MTIAEFRKELENLSKTAQTEYDLQQRKQPRNDVATILWWSRLETLRDIKRLTGYLEE